MIRGVSEGEGIRRVSDMKELVGVGVGGGDSGLVRLVHTKNGLFDRTRTGVRGGWGSIKG